jgi:signal transduction histidine kinase
MEEFDKIEKEELAQRIKWMINIRWVAATFPYLIFILSAQRGEIQIGFPEILPLIAYLLNIFYMIMVRLRKALRFIAYFQLIVDLFLITAGVHFTGGLGSWFDIFIYLIIIIAARALLSLRASLILATLSSILYTTVISLEFLEILPPVPITDIRTILFEKTEHLLTSVIVRVVFFFWIAIIAGHLADIIRKRGEELAKANIKLEQSYQQLKQTQQQLIHSERLAAIGQLATGIGKELRDPLTVIKNALYYIKGKIDKEDKKIADFMKTIDDEIAHSDKIINNLVSFSGLIPPVIKPTAINDVIKDVLEEIEIPKKIKVITYLGKDLPDAMVDGDQIKQVFTNIILNAIESMPNGGKLKISSNLNIHDLTIDVEFEDTGVGIPKDVQDKIFDPLFTTKPKEIGLGLAVCQEIIDRHKGSLKVTSNQGKGTTFVVKLKVMEEENNKTLDKI